MTELFYERGILADPNVNKDIFAGISRVKSYLNRDNGVGNLYIFSTCVNMIDEFKGYIWGSGDTPVKRDDHCLDELRYFIMSRPEQPKNKEGISVIAADKLRRIKSKKKRGSNV